MWRNRNSKQRLFTVIENGDIKENSITTKEINALKLNENRSYYILKTTYFHCIGGGRPSQNLVDLTSRPSSTSVRRVISEVKKVVGGNTVTLEETTYALIEYSFSEIESEKTTAATVLTDKATTSDLVTEDFTTELIKTSYSEQTAISAEKLLTNSKAFPEFENSGLSEVYKSTWQNAATILIKKGVKKHPFFEMKKMVVSLTSDTCHDVTSVRGTYRCDCEGYKRRNICAHIIAVAFECDNLERCLVEFIPKGLQQMCSQVKEVKCAGKKPCYRKRVRSKSNEKRNTDGFQSLIKKQADGDKKAQYEVVFLNDTRATRCYGCKGKLRNDISVTPPPPFDIVLKTKTFRVYREKAKDGNPGILHISKNEENVYFHPQFLCAPDATKCISTEEAIEFRLSNVHKKCFGLSLAMTTSLSELVLF